MNVLALSTSTPHGSVAIVSGGRLLAEASHDDPRGHAEHVFSLVDEVLARASLARADLDLVACDLGPGSFTGVRIAVASAKGIAVGLGLPLAGVLSLEAMAADAATRLAARGPAVVAVAIDAKKDELYLAAYEVAPPAVAGDPPVLLELLAPAHAPIAEASELARSALLGSGDRPRASIVDASSFEGFAASAAPLQTFLGSPKASWIGRLAEARHARLLASGGDGASLASAAEIVPLYVRAPDAVPSPSGAPVALAMLPAR